MSFNREIGQIVIGRPTIESKNDSARMTAIVTVRGEARPVWFEVESKYGKYLCNERSDAFLIGILNYAMREHCDIRCEAPVGAQLLYQIRTYLIPSLVRNSKVLYSTNITADIDATPIQNGGGVGTGISGGVDSFHAIKNYARSDYPGLKLTHLVLNNVGSFWRGKLDHQYEWQANHAREFCREYGFELIQTNSNIADVIPQDHFLTHTYSSAFAIYALQKLWRVYFYGSSGEDFASFSLKNNEVHDSAHYELLSLDVFSTQTLKIYSEGGAIERFDKLKEVVEYEPSYKYLHVCTSDLGPNCCHCKKCLRTLTALDALGALDRYSGVFDIADYKKNRKKRLRWLYAQQVSDRGDKMTRAAYVLLKDQIPPMAKMWVFLLSSLKSMLIRFFPQLYKRYLWCYTRIKGPMCPV